jgi:hypothetical protein
MSYTKRLLCLANSRKLSGRCVAGREVSGERWGAWIRPISGRPHEEVSEEERRYEDGTDPRLGDVIDIHLLEHRPRTYQQENHLLDESRYWVKVRSASWDDIVGALEDAPQPLWENGDSSYNGINDRVPIARAEAFNRSLFLLRPQNLTLLVQAEWGGKRKVRGDFSLGAERYCLVVTDPFVEKRYLAKSNGIYHVDDAVLCISLGEPVSGYAYKLIAAVMTRTRIEGNTTL